MKSEINPSTTHSNLVALSNDQRLFENLQSLSFLNTSHLGQVAYSHSQKGELDTFYTIDKQIGEKGHASHLYMTEFFDGSILIFNRINPIFVLVDEVFLTDKAAMSAKLLKGKIDNENLENEDLQPKFFDSSQFPSPFNNDNLLTSLSNNIFEEKSADIGEDKPVKFFKFSLEKYTLFIKERLDRLSADENLVYNHSVDKVSDSWLILKDYLPAIIWPYFEQKFDIKSLKKTSAEPQVSYDKEEGGDKENSNPSKKLKTSNEQPAKKKNEKIDVSKMKKMTSFFKPKVGKK